MGERAFEQLNIPIYATYCCRYDGDLTFESYSDSIFQLLNFDYPTTLKGSSFFDLFRPAESARYLDELQTQLENGDEVEMLLPVSNDMWVINRGRRLQHQGVVLICGILLPVHKLRSMFDAQQQKISEYKKRLFETADRASRDSLTNVYNAQTTRTLCEDYISQGNKNFALIVIDVDRLKKINDSYGHMAGDQAIICVAKTIKRLFRGYDIVGRIGGDEFLVLMKDVNSSEIVHLRCSQIISSLAEASCSPTIKGRLSCSVGAVVVSQMAGNYDAIFQEADQAMYRVKFAGGGSYMVCDHFVI